MTKTITNGSFTKFDGSILQYLPWRARFIAAAHSKNVSVQAKQQYMTSSIESKSSPFLTTLLNSTLYSEDGYRHAIRLLEQTYGGPDQDTRRYEAELDDMPRLVPNNLASVSDWLARIQSVRMAWAVANPAAPNATSYILRSITQKAPQTFQVDWNLWLGQAARQPSLANLVDYLTMLQAALRRTASTPTRTQPPPMARPRRPAQSNQAVMEEEDPETLRSFSSKNCCGSSASEEDCEGDDHIGEFSDMSNEEDEMYAFTTQRQCAMGCEPHHLLKNCDKFMKLKPLARADFIRKDNRCVVCLSKNDKCKPCKKNYTCRVCKKKHNTLLHFEKEEFPQANKEKQENKTRLSSDESRPSGPTTKEMTTKDEATSTSLTSSEPIMDEIFCHQNGIKSSLKSLRCIPVRLAHPVTNESMTVNALMDDGSTDTMISEFVHQSLALGGTPFKLQLIGTGGIKTPYKSTEAEVNIASLDGSFNRNVTVRVIPDPVGPYKPVDWNKFQNNWKHLADLKLAHPVKNRSIDIMIGSDQIDLMASLKEIVGKENQPCARLTKLGWTVAGPTCGMSIATSLAAARIQEETCEEYQEYYDAEITYAMKAAAEDYDQRYRGFYEEELNEQVRKFIVADLLDCEAEDGGKISNEDRYVLNKVKHTHQRLEDGRHQIGVAWKRGEPKLINNRKQALARLEGLERHPFMQTLENRKRYQDIIKQHLDEGFIEKVPPEDLGRRDAFYLAHFPVLRPDKCTTKIRIVFDGRQRYYNKALNDAVHKGPNLSNCLFTVLLKFRKNPIAVMGDIKQMFLQVSMAPEDRHYHRFLYRLNPKDEPVEYQWCRHPFGNSGSPFVCQFVMRQQAEQFRSKYPDVVDLLYCSTVVDDTLASVRTPQQAIRLITAIIEIYAGGQWDIRKFASNNAEVMQAIPEEKRAPQVVLNSGSLDGEPKASLTGALGLKWSPTTDTFTFRFAQAKKIKGKWSKRSILTTQASVFDPLGQLSPFVQKARMIMQELWKANLEWDEAISPEHQQRWLEWAQQLDELPEVQFHRCLQPSGEIEDEELHTFSDASATGYGAATYLLTKYEDNTVVTNLAMSKSRVVPIKAETIPRLELRAAVLGVELWQLVSKALNVKKEKSYFWTDSGAVLAWIKTPSKVLKMYVANRTLRIQDLTEIENWRWTPTDQNPADIISRGADLQEFVTNDLWLHGPTYLKDGAHPDQERVPIKKEAISEMKKDVLEKNPELQDHPDMMINLTSIQADERLALSFNGQSKLVPVKFLEYLPDPERFSRWKRLLGTTVRILQMCNGHRLERMQAEDQARLLLIRREQAALYLEEIKALKQNQRVPRKSPLAKLDPFIDDQGIIRITSRLKLSELVPRELKYPIVLPKSHLGRLIIQHQHEDCLHTGYIDQPLSGLRKLYHIHGGRREVRKVLNHCQVCRKAKPHIHKFVEGALQDFRLPNPGSIQTFQKASMDVAGPMIVKAGTRGRPSKRYVLVITCTVTRAVALEALNSLDLPTFIMAFERFLAEHNKPEEVLTDNFSTFRSADKVLADLISTLCQGDLETQYPDIKWRFTPPHTPHYNGVTERLIATVKKAIRAAHASYTPNDEEFRTLLKKIQKVMNDRPLSYVTPSNDELLPLTPNHFIIGRITTPVVPMDKEAETLGPRYRRLQKALWKSTERFHNEILPLYHEHRAPKGRQFANLKEGDIVSAIDTNPAKKNIWHIGRVVEAQESQDGIVRTVLVFFPGNKGGKGICLRRHINKLALLTPHHL